MCHGQNTVHGLRSSQQEIENPSIYIYIVYVIYTYIYIYISKYVCNIGHEIIPAFHGAMFISQLDPIHGYIDSTDATVPGIEIQRQGLET